MNENKEMRLFEKAAALKEASIEVTDKQLEKINDFTLEPLTKEQVFVFKLCLADNEIDDRNYEPFNLNALKDLKKLYIGKTVIKDHDRAADNQVARIFDTELEEEDSETGAGEKFTKLIGYAYMVKTDSNADLIAEIKGGIKKEVSTGCSPKRAVCSICGKDNLIDYCEHFWGKTYGEKTCYFTLDGAKDAYEVSLVAVPAQKRAGVCKDATKTLELAKEKELTAEKTAKENAEKKAAEINARIRLAENFTFTKN